MVDLPPEQFEGELPHPVRTLKFRPRHVPRCFPACGQVPPPTMPCHVGHQRCCLALTPRLRYTFMSHRSQTCRKLLPSIRARVGSSSPARDPHPRPAPGRNRRAVTNRPLFLKDIPFALLVGTLLAALLATSVLMFALPD